MIESINLNLIPSGVSPVCHVSQYDAGRQIKINLFEGINPYTILSGDTFTLNVRKPDNTIVTTTVSGTQGNTYVTISTTEQIAAIVGENLCELKITNGSTVIGTLNFIMQVERDVLSDGIPSQSVIEDLDERIAEAIGDNYYNKTETDALLNNKADKSNTYTKTETDSLLALKADKSNTYTKSETDALLALKVDKSELYNVYPTEQESGAIASFTDGADSIPVKSLVSEIVAVESGNGEKSPDNPYTLSGFSKADIVVRASKNFFDKTTATNGYRIGADGNPFPQADYSISDWIETVPNIPIVANVTFSAYDGLAFYDSSKTFIERITSGSTVKVPTNAKYIRVAVNNSYLNTYQLQYGTTSTTYEAYSNKINTYIFAFGQTVYGGYFDNKGNLVSVFANDRLDSKTWSYNSGRGAFNTIFSGKDQTRFNKMICSCYANGGQVYSASDIASKPDKAFYTQANSDIVFIKDSDYTDPTTWLNALGSNTLCYPLTTPTTLAISSQDIPTLSGENNIFSNTGDVDVTIRADIGLYIDKRLNANRSTPNNLSRAASYVDDPESANETQEDNVEPQNEER